MYCTNVVFIPIGVASMGKFVSKRAKGNVGVVSDKCIVWRGFVLHIEKPLGTGSLGSLVSNVIYRLARYKESSR